MSSSDIATYEEDVDDPKGDRFGQLSGLEEYLKVDPKDPKYREYVHAAHVFIYAKTNSYSFGISEDLAIVLMQMRFDGYLGFPGGLIDAGETSTYGLNRELEEEINWKTTKSYKGPVKDEHFQFAHVNPEHKLVLYFYAVEVNERDIKNIEKNSVNAKDHGVESLGLVRVPLYTMSDGYRGFPCFLHNNFIGNAKTQLLETLKQLKILDDDYIQQSLKGVPKSYKKKLGNE